MGGLSRSSSTTLRASSIWGRSSTHLALGFLSPGAIYLGLVWLVFLLPGASAYVLLCRVLGHGWLALPGAFLALTISAESRSGIEEGLRWGLVAARLGWGLLPLLALSLLPWLEGTGRPRAWPALLVAAVALAHPAHLPAALALVLLAGVCAPGGWRAWWRDAALVVGVGLGLAGFWLLPLMAAPRGAGRPWRCPWPGATRRPPRWLRASRVARCYWSSSAVERRGRGGPGVRHPSVAPSPLAAGAGARALPRDRGRCRAG